MLKITSLLAQNIMRAMKRKSLEDCRCSKWTGVRWQMWNASFLLSSCAITHGSLPGKLATLFSAFVLSCINSSIPSHLSLNAYIRKIKEEDTHKWPINQQVVQLAFTSSRGFGRDTRQAVGDAPAPASTLAAPYRSWMSYPGNFGIAGVYLEFSHHST